MIKSARKSNEKRGGCLKTEMMILAGIVLGCLLGCSRTESPVDTQPVGDPFTIDAVDYATNYFFVDTSYRARFQDYLESPEGTYWGAGISLESVWIERLSGPPDPNELSCKAFLSLPLWKAGGYDALQSVSDRPGEVESGAFVRLNQDEYSVPMYGMPGIIALRVPVSDDRAIAVCFLMENGMVGEFPWGVNFDSTLASRPVIMKLLKPRNLFATGLPHSAWTMHLRNVYKIGFRNIERRDFLLTISYTPVGGVPVESIFGHTLLSLLGVDRLDANGSSTAGGDGLFDFVVGKTIDAEHGELILPSLSPFDWGISDGLLRVGTHLQDTSRYRLSLLYDTTQSVASSLNRGLYTIRGRAVHF